MVPTNNEAQIQLDKFSSFAKDVVATDATLDCFSQKWKSTKPFGDVTWEDFRGTHNETALGLLYMAQIRNSFEGGAQRDAYRSLFRSALVASPHLAGVVMDREPYTGCTILHQSCARGDLEIVRLLTDVGANVRQHLDLNGRITGMFLQQLLTLPGEVEQLRALATPTVGGLEGDSPLEVALLHAKEDDESLELMRLLLQAGASPVFHDQEGKVLYTLLHVLARGRWEGHGPHHIPKDRTRRVFELLMGVGSKQLDLVDPAMKNRKGYTAMQVAAIYGNELMYAEMLDWMKVFVWEWGSKSAFGFPLEEIDSATPDEDNSALELMVLYDRSSLLNFGIMSHMINEKWDRFGWKLLLISLIFETVMVFCCAIVCVDNAEGFKPVRWYCRHVVIICTATYLCVMGYLYMSRGLWSEPFCMALRENFFKGKQTKAMTLWSVITFRQCIEFFLVLTLVVSAPWYQAQYTTVGPTSHYVFVWHIIASLWWIVLMSHLLRYFELFESTSSLATAIPYILYKDMVPFTLVYAVMLLCWSVALRVAAAPSYGPGDPTAGTWWRTILSLEESIHGPDVRWREFVGAEATRFMPGFLFVGFLWLSLMMMSIILAMFSVRYDELRDADASKSRILRSRARYTIVAEKLLPLRQNVIQVGSRLGQRTYTPEAAAAADGRPAANALVAKPQKGLSRIGSSAKSPVGATDKKGLSTEKMPLLCSEQSAPADRWLIWQEDAKHPNSWHRAFVEIV